jgi:CO/xanthine dehydrogenase Mo-binding subunit
MSEIVAEELEIPLNLITVRALDTTKVPYDSGVGGSRATQVYGNAAHDAATNARRELLMLAAKIRDGTPDEFVLGAGFVCHRSGKQMSYGDIAKRKGSPIYVQGYYNDKTSSSEASICALVAEVQVCTVTGQIRVRQITTAHHTGTIINPLMHQGQIEGGIIMGLGYTLTEQLEFDEGKVVTANFGEYKIPTILDIPRLKTIILEEPIGPGPYKSMSIGELPNVPVVAAIANAVHDAVNVRIKSLPITAERTLKELRRLM